MLRIWKKRYALRKWNAQTITNGYYSSSYTDTSIVLDVQPNGNDSQPDDSGKRLTSGLVAYGDTRIETTDRENGKRGDWIFYNGAWYECVSSEYYEHTILRHWTSRFVKVPENIPAVEKTMPEVN